MDEHSTLRGIAARDLTSRGPAWRGPAWRELAPVLGAGIVVVLIVYLRYRPWDLHTGVLIGAPFGRDFVNFWMAGRLALVGSLRTLTDLPAYNDLIARTFAHTVPDTFLFSYPPHLLLVLAPLSRLHYGLALSLWTAANLLALAVATRMVAGSIPRRGLMIAASCLSPAALLMVLYGHFGGLLALMFVIALVDSEARPVLAGLCLAALTVKPQFAVVVAVVLLGAGRWRCLPVAALATLVLVAASVLLFGVDPWRGFVSIILPEQTRMLTEFDAGMLGTTISPYLGARSIGLTSGAACLVQGVVSMFAVGAATLVLRQKGAVRATALVLPLAAILALPYANHYDLAIAAPALTLLVVGNPDQSPAAVLRLVAWIAPPLAWHLNWLGIPLVPVVLIGVLASSCGLSVLRPKQPCPAG